MRVRPGISFARTIPVHGVGGSWIVKLPSARYKAIPENEFAMLELARPVGISVPEDKLVNIASITGLPEQAHTVEGNALALKRFDRLPNGEPVHMEDFAQVFGSSRMTSTNTAAMRISPPSCGRKALRNQLGNLFAASCSRS